MTLELSEAETLLDKVIEDQRKKGRRTYGQALDWRSGDGSDAPYDWRQMALEEAVDLAQYLCAEVVRLRYNVRRLEQELDTAVEEKESSALTFDNYQNAALRTAPAQEPSREALAIRALGLAGEAGEVVELVKKYLGHGHDFDRDKLRKELGDVLWYVATLADATGLSLGEVAQHNIDKLRARYPDGFSHEASLNRKS